MEKRGNVQLQFAIKSILFTLTSLLLNVVQLEYPFNLRRIGQLHRSVNGNDLSIAFTADIFIKVDQILIGNIGHV